jgi:hypothetical protein
LMLDDDDRVRIRIVSFYVRVEMPK